MKKSTFDQWLAELQAELALLDGEVIEPIKRLKHTLPLISGIINGIKEKVIANGFESPEAEIHFFKVVKPGFYALQIFELEWFNLTSNRPAGTNQMISAFYEQELLYFLRFFRNNAFYYQYYHTHAAELDPQYFLRDGRPGDIPVLDVIDPLPGFSTALDYLFAKFIAYERLQYYIIDQLTLLYTGERKEKMPPKLRWTGEKVNLVELAYGILYTRQVNEGKAEIGLIIDWLSSSLGAGLTADRAYRMFLDIKRRKSISPTRFIDRMQQEVGQHITNSFGIKKNKSIPSSKTC